MLTSLRFLFSPGKTFKSDLILDFRKKLYFRLQALMFTYHLFHPYHIVPSSKFISALMKFSDHLIAHMSMKLDTVFRQIFVFLLRISDAGVKVEKMLLSGNPFDFLIKT